MAKKKFSDWVESLEEEEKQVSKCKKLLIEGDEKLVCDVVEKAEGLIPDEFEREISSVLFYAFITVFSTGIVTNLMLLFAYLISNQISPDKMMAYGVLVIYYPDSAGIILSDVIGMMIEPNQIILYIILIVLFTAFTIITVIIKYAYRKNSRH